MTVRKPNLVVEAYTRRAGALAVREAALGDRERTLLGRAAEAAAERRLLGELRDWYLAAADRHDAYLRRAGEEARCSGRSPEVESHRLARIAAEEARWADENARWEGVLRAYQARAASREARARSEDTCWETETDVLRRGHEAPARVPKLPE